MVRKEFNGIRTGISMSEMGRLSSWLESPDNTGFSGENFFEQPIADRPRKNNTNMPKPKRGCNEIIP
jgi:hypothetical protein